MILCVGRLSPVKDHPTLIRAAALLRERWGKPFRVVILGGPAGPKDEPYVRSLHQLVEELNLQRHRFLPSTCPSECLAALVSALHGPCEFDSYRLRG
jgi:glycosyltransferase involved in cell wall biosynthesis